MWFNSISLKGDLTMCFNESIGTKTSSQIQSSKKLFGPSFMFLTVYWQNQMKA